MKSSVYKLQYCVHETIYILPTECSIKCEQKVLTIDAIPILSKKHIHSMKYMDIEREYILNRHFNIQYQYHSNQR